MHQPTIACLILSTLLASAGALAGETIARWVDADGVTHFGDVQLAPSHATVEVVGPANGMAAPPVQAAGSRASGPSWSLVPLPPKQNPKGWRTKGDGVRHGAIQRGR